MNLLARPAALLLLLLCGSLSALLAYQLLGPEEHYDVPQVSLPVALPQIPVLTAFEPPPAELLVEMTERPVFNPKRQPIQLPTEKKEAPPPPPQLAFIGTISQAGEQ